VQGIAWEKLEQRGKYPAVEDVIAFSLNLRDYFDMSLNAAYAQACKEFVQLRAAHEMATMAAEMEARFYGAEFKRDPFERYFLMEGKSLDTLKPDTANPQASTSSRVKYHKPRRWTYTVPPDAVVEPEFSEGMGYAERWRVLPEPKPKRKPSRRSDAANSSSTATGEESNPAATPNESTGEDASAAAGGSLPNSRMVELMDPRSPAQVKTVEEVVQASDADRETSAARP